MLLPVPPSDLIADAHEAIDAIKTAAGLTDKQFTALCVPILRSYAEHVQNLPLSRDAYGAPRGAWEFGLAAAMVAYRYAGTVVFYPTLGSEERRALEPQCKYMAFVATLASSLAMVAEAGELSDGDDIYHALSYADGLQTWLKSHQGRTFRWRSPQVPLSAQAAAAIAAHFIPRRLLTNFDQRVVLMMYGAVNPKATMNGVESTLARVVREAMEGVLSHYKQKRAGTYMPDTFGQSFSTNEAEALTKQMAAVAHPSIPANPLQQTSGDQTPSPVSVPHPSGGGELPPVPNPTPNSGPSQPGLASTNPIHINRVAVQPDISDQGVPTLLTSQEAQNKLDRAHQVLREWFGALKQHEQFHVLRDELVMNEKGIELPVSMLGMFGVSGAAIRKMMDDAGLILGRTANARGIVLHPGLRQHFGATEAN